MDDEQSNGAAGFASSDVKEFLVGVNRMNLRSDKLGSKDRTPSHDSRSSRHHRRRRITSSSDECNRRGDGGDDGSSSTSPANQEDVAEEANHVDGPPEDSIICQACCEIVPPTSDHVIIKPCMHTHCNLCIIKSQVERGWRPHKCPAKGCDCESETLEYVSSGGGSEEICKPTSDLRTFPALYLKENHKNEIMASSNNQGIAISCTKAKLNQDGEMVSNTWTSTFVIRKNSDGTVDVLDMERALKEIGNAKCFPFCTLPLPSEVMTTLAAMQFLCSLHESI